MLNRKRILKQAACIFRDLALRGFLHSLEYRQKVADDYDPQSGPIENFCTHYIAGYITKFDKRELSNQVLATDLKVLIRLEELGIEPSIDDKIVINELTYSLVSYEQPALSNDGTISLQLRF